MAYRKPYIVTKTQPIRSVHDFTQSHDEWERSVFDNAAMFSIVQYDTGIGLKASTTSLTIAIQTAKMYKRRLLYATSKEGRYVMIPEDRWDAYLEIWEKRNAM